MSKAKTQRVPILISIMCLLAVAVYLDRSAPERGPVTVARRDAPQANPSRKPHPVSMQHPLSNLRLTDLSQTVSRPLFEPSRRAVARAPAPAPAMPIVRPEATAPDAASLRLVGVVTGIGTATAIIAKGGAQPFRIEQGEFVDGWEVVKVTPTEVTLVQDGRRVALKLLRR